MEVAAKDSYEWRSEQKVILVSEIEPYKNGDSKFPTELECKTLIFPNRYFARKPVQPC